MLLTGVPAWVVTGYGHESRRRTATCFPLPVAGHEISVNLICGAYALLTHPEQLALLGALPALLS